MKLYLILLVTYLLITVSTFSPNQTQNLFKAYLSEPQNGKCSLGYGLYTSDEGESECLPCQSNPQMGCARCQITDKCSFQCLQTLEQFIIENQSNTITFTGSDAHFCGQNTEKCTINFNNTKLFDYNIINCEDNLDNSQNIFNFDNTLGYSSAVCLDCGQYETILAGENSSFNYLQCTGECNDGYQLSQSKLPFLEETIFTCEQKPTNSNPGGDTSIGNQCLNELNGLVNGVIQQEIVASDDNYQIKLLYDPSQFSLNLDCFTQKVTIGDTQVNTTQNDEKGVVLEINATTIGTDYDNCIVQDDTVYCIVKLVIYYKEIEQHIYSFNLYSNLLTKSAQLKTVATTETGINTTNPKNVQSQIIFCTDFTCNYEDPTPVYLRQEEFYFQLKLTSSQHKDIKLSHHSLQIGEFNGLIVSNNDINSQQLGIIIYRYKFPLALGDTTLKLTVKLNEFQASRLLQESNEDYGINPSVEVTFLEEEDYQNWIDKQTNEQHRKRVKAQKLKKTEEKYVDNNEEKQKQKENYDDEIINTSQNVDIEKRQ